MQSFLVLVYLLLKENVAVFYDSIFLRHVMVPSFLCYLLVCCQWDLKCSRFPLEKKKKKGKKGRVRSWASAAQLQRAVGTKSQSAGREVGNQWEWAGDGQGGGGRGRGGNGSRKEPGLVS